MTPLFDIRSTWLRLSSRERALIALGLLVVVFGAGWPLLWQPIERDLEVRTAELAATRLRASEAQRAADEVVGLQRSAKAPRTADLRRAAESVVTMQGMKGALTALEASEGRVRLTFAAIDAVALAALVEALGRDELLFVSEAILATRVEPGRVRAELVLARPAGR